jgi:hypothetical protein
MSVYLNKLIELYLNDVEDYYSNDLLLAESALKPMRQLITEGKKDQNQIIIEALKKATPEHKPIIEDFLLYMREEKF